jgi:tape measure domain-containing protein
MAQNIIFRVVADTQPAVDGMDKLQSATKQTTNSVSGLDKSLAKLGTMVAGAFAVDKLIQFGKEAAKVAGEMESIRMRLNSIAGGVNEGGVAMQELQNLANRLGLEFKGLAGEYAKFVGAAKASGIEVAKADRIFKSMSIAIAGSGASAEQSNRAFMALTQMMGKGKISAEEMRQQLGEALPQAFGIMAKSLGVTTQELDKMMANGELLAGEVLPKFAREMESAFGADAEKLATGLNANINRLTNSWDAFLTQVGQSKVTALAVDLLTGSVEALSVAWALVTDNYSKYAQSKLNAERDAKISSEMQPIVKQIRKEIESYGDAEVAISEYTKKYNTLAGEVQDADRRIESNRKRRLGVAADVAITQEFVTQNELKRATLKIMEEELDILRSSQKAEIESTESIKEKQKKLDKIRKEQEKAKNAELKSEKDRIQGIAFFSDFLVEKESENAKKIADAKKKYNDLIRVDLKTNETDIQAIRRKNFELELRQLNGQYKDKLIQDEEYLLQLSALRKKYGIEDKKNTETLESDIVATKQKKEELKRDIIVQTATGTVDTLMAYKKKELDGEADMVEKQRQAGLISEEQYDQQMRAIKRKQAIADRIAAIAQIAINTAVALTNPTNIASFGAISPFIIASGAIQAGIVLAQPLPYNKGTKRVPMMRGAVRGRDSVHAILTPDERVVPADINMQPGYSALLDLAQDKKISDKEAGFLAELATSGMRRTGTQQSIDPDVIGKAIAKHIPHTNVAINDRGIAVITERSQTEIRRLRRRIG